MAFLLDFNAIVIAKTATATNDLGRSKTDLAAVRNYFFRDILHLRQKFVNDGNFVICRDDVKNWRKDFFPYYKITRKETRAEAPFDWELCKDAIQTIGQELADNFPYKTVVVPNCEADDVIAVLTKHIRGWRPDLELCNKDEEVIIGSRDGDFRSLQKIPRVRQYSPTDKRFIIEPDPVTFLREKILTGDKGDAVPNVLSEDDAIAMKIRQKPITAARIEKWEGHWKEHGTLHPELDPRKYDRNRILVDLVDGIPKEIEQSILETYAAIKPTNRLKTASYFIAHGMRDMHSNLQFF